MARRLPTLFLLLSAALLAAGCGGSSDASSASDSDAASDSTSTATTSEAAEDGTVGIELGEFFVKPSTDSTSAGEVTFEIENSGSTTHQFVIYRTNEEADALPQDGGVAKLDPDRRIAASDDVTAGGTATVTATLEAGRYLLLCNLPGHYMGGQVTEFEVT